MNQQQISIQASPETLRGVYSNLMQVAHTSEEFALDFFMVVGPNGVLSSRVMLSPGHLKRMIAALEDNMKKYEANFGNVAPANEPKVELGFQTR